MTAVEWLEVQIKNTPNVENLMNQLDAFIKEAKEMEKQQIIDAYNIGFITPIEFDFKTNKTVTAEQYYNETYKNETETND